MTGVFEGILLVALLALAVAGAVRPWIALIALLALLPFNGWLTNVIAADLGLTDPSRTLLAAWHDALVVGILTAAGLAWARTRPRTMTRFDAAAAALLVSGLVSLAVGSHLRTGLYAYRTLYEPIALAVALTVLARTQGRAEAAVRRAPLAIVGAGTMASLLSFWQVYAGGVPFLHRYFTDPNGQLPSAYFASLISQPRGFGTFNSPNEFGAYLVIALGLIVGPGVLRAPAAVKGWAAVVLGLALLLSLSRSAWVGFVIVALAAGMLGRAARPSRNLSGASLHGLRMPTTYAFQLIIFVLLAGTIVVTSGAPRFLEATAVGRDPSSASRVETVQHFLADLFNPAGGAASTPTTPDGSAAPAPGQSTSTTPDGSAAPAPGQSTSTKAGGSSSLGSRIGLFGIGLGMAGPKSDRFGEIPPGEWITSETWYVDFVLQAGMVGFVALVTVVLIVTRGLWLRRRRPLARSAFSIAAGLAIGAIFIPVIDEPAVAIPLWSVIGLALAQATTPRVSSSPGAHPSD